MAKIRVEGDRTAFEVIAAALRSAGLGAVEIEFAPRRPDVTRFPTAPANWAALVDAASELPYADWRTEVLSLVDGADARPVGSATAEPERMVTTLRRAV